MTVDEKLYDITANIRFDYTELNLDNFSQLSKSDRLAQMREYHFSQNQQIINKLRIDNYEMSEYAPFAEIKYDSSKEYYAKKAYLKRLSRKNEIANIEICLIVNFSDAVGANSACPTVYYWDQALADVGITNENSQLFNGQGVKIGVMEAGVPHPSVLNGTTYHCNVPGQYDSENYLDEHATNVMTIITGPHGLVPDATIYHSRSGSTYASFNYFSQNEVDIINNSTTWAFAQEYDNYAAYVDYIVDATGVIFINSAGNTPYEQNGSVINSTFYTTSPGLGINVITVGASNAEKYVSYFSRYGTLDFAAIYKPDFVAPGEKLQIPFRSQPISGTSFSAPIVTAIVAKLMQEYSELAENPALTRAVLAQSCNLLPTQTNLLNNKAGAGLVSCANARYILSQQQYLVSYKPDYEDENALIDTTVYISPSTPLILRFCVQIPGYQIALNGNYCELNLSLYRFKIVSLSSGQVVVNRVYDGSTGYIYVDNPDPGPVGYQVIVELEEDAFVGYIETVALTCNQSFM